MAPKEEKKGKGVKAISEPSPPAIENHLEPTSGHGKFYYANGAIYEGEWIVAPSSIVDNAKLEAENNDKGSKDQKKGDKSSKDDSKKKGKGDAKVDEKIPPKSPKKDASENNKQSKGEKIGENESSPSNGELHQELPRPNYIRHGKGVYIDGEYHYEGEWKDDQISGLGTFRYASGAAYIGNWDKNKYYGMGEYKWGDGRSYKGNWRESKMHGMGVYTDQSGQHYAGHFFNGIGPGLSCEIN